MYNPEVSARQIGALKETESKQQEVWSKEPSLTSYSLLPTPTPKSRALSKHLD